MFAILMPGYQVYQSWYGGMLVHHHKTRGISEAVLVYVSMALFGLWLHKISHLSGDLLDHQRFCNFRDLSNFLFEISL